MTHAAGHYLSCTKNSYYKTGRCKKQSTDEEYEDRREKLLNSVIADVCIDLRHTELGDPTKELMALVGYQHLVDLKTLLPGHSGTTPTRTAPRARLSTTGRRSCRRTTRRRRRSWTHMPHTHAVPGQAQTFGIDGRVLGRTVGAWSARTST